MTVVYDTSGHTGWERGNGVEVKLTRQSTMVVLAVPLIGVGFAASWTDVLLDTPVAAGPVARIAHPGGPGSRAAGLPLAGLLDAASTAPAVATPRPPAAAVVRRRPVPGHVPAPVRRSRPAVAMRDRLISGDGTLDTAVGVYTDCSGRTPLPRTEAEVDSCYPDPTYILGHNLGVFSPLMHMGVGSLITYYDGDGQAHPWRVVFVHDRWPIGPGRPAPAGPEVVAQLQTCASRDGSVGRILDVAAA